MDGREDKKGAADEDCDSNGLSSYVQRQAFSGNARASRRSNLYRSDARASSEEDEASSLIMEATVSGDSTRMCPGLMWLSSGAWLFGVGLSGYGWRGELREPMELSSFMSSEALPSSP